MVKWHHFKNNHVSWNVQADFTTSFPLTHVKIKLCQEISGFLGAEDKEIAKVGNITEL